MELDVVLLYLEVDPGLGPRVENNKETRKDRFSVPVKKLHDMQSLSYLLCMVICTHIVVCV